MRSSGSSHVIRLGRGFGLIQANREFVLKQTENSIRPVIRILDEENRLTEKVYQLNKNKNVSILQVEN